MEQLLSKHQREFWKGFSIQNCLLSMLERWKSFVDKGKVHGALLTDLSKAFSCLFHELIIEQSNAYGFSLLAIKPVRNYLIERKQKTKIN